MAPTQVTAQQQSTIISLGQTFTATATCPAGKTVVGGGFFVTDTSGIILPSTFTWSVIQNAPTSATSWTAQIRLTGIGLSGVRLTTYAVCI